MKHDIATIIQGRNGFYWYSFSETNEEDIPIYAKTDEGAMHEVEKDVFMYYLDQRNQYDTLLKDFRESMIKLRGESK